MAYTVLGGSQVLPGGIPKNKWYNDVGYLQGTTGRQVVDVLLAALLGQHGGGLGRVPTLPTPQRPGQLTFPTGATTPTSPEELAQMRQLGGAPTTTGQTVPFSPAGGTGISYAPPTKLGFKPNLTYQVQQAQLEKARQDLDPNSPINQFLTAQAGAMRSGTVSQTPGSANPLPSSGFYREGDVVERAGKRWKIVGFDDDGTPLVDPE